MENRVVPELREQSQLLADLKARLRESSPVRWTVVEIYEAINDALIGWHNRVQVPFVHDLPSGWQVGVYEYALPDYVTEPMQPQRRVLTPYVNDGSGSTQWVWSDVDAWRLEPDGDGGQLLRTDYSIGSLGTTNEGRVLWWGYNSRVPAQATLPTLQASIDGDDTTLVLDGVEGDVDRVGFVRVDNEYMQYNGHALGTNGQLLNVVRGINGTTATTHTNGTTVDFCIALPQVRLLTQLYDAARAYLFGLYMPDANESERARFERLMLHYQKRADEWWMTWAPSRGPKLRMSRRAWGGWARQR